jgi:hypothetical protein
LLVESWAREKALRSLKKRLLAKTQAAKAVMEFETAKRHPTPPWEDSECDDGDASVAMKWASSDKTPPDTPSVCPTQ